MLKKTLSLVALTLFTASAAFGASAMDKDVIIAGTHATYPPYEMRDENGEIAGFDIELTNLIVERLGKKIEWQDMAFDGLIPAITTNRIDIAAAGMSATAERQKIVTFSEPYEISFSAFVMRPNNAVKDVDELTGKVVAVQLGTVQETYTRALGNLEVKTFQSFDDCIREVILERAEATLMDIPVAKRFLSAKDFQGKAIIAFNKQITGADKALAMNKNDTTLIEAVNKVIIDLKASGELEALRNKWFK